MKVGCIIVIFIIQGIGCIQTSTRCPVRWLERPEGKSCYRFWPTRMKNWTEARETCKERDGDLLKLDSRHEKEWIINEIEKYPVHYEWWVGLQRHSGNDSIWLWTDGTSRNESNNYIPWGSGEPNNYRDSEDCAEIWDNLLNDKNCDQPLQFICERPKDLPMQCDVDNGWDEVTSAFCSKFFSEKATFSDAVATCSKEDGSLLTIGDAITQKRVADFLDHENKAKVWLQYEFDTSKSDWLNLNGFVASSDWWENGIPDTKTVIHNDTLCSVMDTSSKSERNWKPEDCDATNSFMCQKLPGTCPYGYIQHKTMCYLLNTQEFMTWNEARGFCNLRQTTLLEIRNDNDWYFILSKMKEHFSLTKINSVWLGLSGEDVDSLTWDSVSEVDEFVKTMSRGKMDAQPGTQCGFVDYGVETKDKSQWKFGACDESRGVVCTVPVNNPILEPPPQKPRYECPEGYTLNGVMCYHWNPDEPVDWYTAREKCAKEGADLVTIQSEEEQIFVYSHIQSESWIGLNDRRKEGTFTWLDTAAEVGMAFWFKGQPNNVEIGSQYSENCVAMLYLPGQENHGKWVDYPCSYKARFLCQIPADWNIALGKLATQSSLYMIEMSYDSYSYDYVPSVASDDAANKAIDGCTKRAIEGKSSSCCARTDTEDTPWWMVDLGTYYPIGKIEIHRQSEEPYLCSECISKFRNFRVFISNASQLLSGDLSDMVYQENRNHIPAIVIINPKNVTVGRYVRIDIPRSTSLTLCEVKIIRGESLQRPVSPTNSNCITDSTKWAGDIRHTVSGRICQAWVQNFPHVHSYHDKSFPDGTEKEADNFCRDPMGEGQPWCYTMDPDVRWEFCPVPHCISDAGSIQSEEKKDKTKAGCDTEWTEDPNSGACYWLGDGLLTWADAQSLCKSVRATLSVPKTEGDIELLTGKLASQKSGLLFWLGVYYQMERSSWISDTSPVSNFILDKLGTTSPTETLCVVSDQLGNIQAKSCLERNAFSCVIAGSYTKYNTSSDEGYKLLPESLILKDTESSVTTYKLKFEFKGFDGATLELHKTADSKTKDGYQIRIGGKVSIKSSISKLNSKTPKYTNIIPDLCNADEYKEFWLQWTSGNSAGDTIAVGRGKDIGRSVFMQWTDPAGIQATTVYFGTVMKSDWRFEDGSKKTLQKESASKGSVNLALHRPARQSSSFSYHSGPEKVVDACKTNIYASKCVSHTKLQFEPWWEVDLGQVYPIREVVIYRRGPECCSKRLGYFRLIISLLSDSTLEEDVVYQSKSEEPPYIMHIPVNGKHGRYVKIDIPGRKEYLELAEVEVYEDLDASRCGNGWFDYETDATCYKVSEVQMDWDSAKRFCEDFNSAMVVPNTAAEQLFLYENSLPVINGDLNSKSVWLGLHDRDSEGSFKLTNGSALAYTDWGEGEPNNFGSGEDCGALRIDSSDKSGKWNDQNCKASLRAMCKKNELLTTTSTTTTTTTTQTTTTTTVTTTVTEKPIILSQGDCNPDWLQSPVTSSCFRIFQTSEVSFSVAASQCIKLDARLAKIENSVEQDFIAEMITRKRIIGKTWEGLWCGGLDEYVEGVWQWFMDNTTMHSSVRWVPGQPDNAGIENCALVLTNPSKFALLNDGTCDNGMNVQGYICQYNLGNKPCKDGWIYNGETDTCYKYERLKKAKWNDARLACSQENAVLTTIGSKSEQYFIKALVADSNVKGVWVGAHDMKEEGIFQWIDGTTFIDKLWAPDQPNNWKSNQHCAMVNVKGIQNALGLLQDDFCEDKYSYICAIRNCDRGWVKFEQNCYLFSLINRGWEDAKADCELQGARLLIVDNEKEHSYIREQFKDLKINYMWIGARYDFTYGAHRWIDGSPMTFTAWGPGQPDPVNGCVDYLKSYNYMWNSHNDCKYTKGAYICEKESLFAEGLTEPTKPTTSAAVTTTMSSTTPLQITTKETAGKCGPDWDLDPTSATCYKFVIELANWRQAQTKCDEDGGNLVSIISDQEQSYITGRLQGLQRLPEAMWIGASDSDLEAGWKWTDGKPFAYLNWAFGEPNNYVASDSSDVGPEGEDCVAVVTGEKQYFGQWNDLPCTSERGYICKKSVDSELSTMTTRPLTTKPDVEDGKFYGCSGAGWLGYKDSCFLVVQEQKDWNEANRYCHTEGAELASIADVNEQNFLFSQFPQDSYCFNIWNDTKCNTWAERGECVRNPVWMATHCHLACKHCLHDCRDIYYSSSKCLEWARIGECDKNPKWMVVNCAMSCGVCQGAPTRGYWIGLLSNGMDQSYSWSDHSEVRFTHWDNHQPRWFNLRPRSCVAMFIQNGKWNDGQCSDPLPGFFCKKQKKLLSVTTKSPFEVGCSMESSFGYGAYCYVYVKQQKSWSNAKSNCKSLGGHLSYIGNMYTQAFVASELQNLLQDYWIGLSVSNGNWSWDGRNQTKLSITHFDKTVKVDEVKDGCFAMTTYKPVGLWHLYADCSLKLPSICQVPREGFTTTVPTTTLSSTTLPDCTETWQPYGKYCYKVSDEEQRWQVAQQICTQYGGSLVSIHNDDENEAVAAMTGLQDRFWIGLHDTNIEGDFVWEDGSPVDFLAWNNNEPNNANNEDCAELRADISLWNDVGCNAVKRYICKIPRGKEVNTTPHKIESFPACNESNPDDGWVRTGEFCYFLGIDELVTWHDAMLACKTKSSELASIHTKEEQYFLSSLRIQAKDVTWIGLNDLDLNNRFDWNDGTVVDFTAWATGQPNDNLGGEKCVTIYYDETWHDYPCNDFKPYICKRRKDGATVVTTEATTPVIRGGCPTGFNYTFENKCYLFSFDGDTTNWADAKDRCDILSGHLVSIHSVQEQDFIALNVYGLSNAMWLGMHNLNVDGRFDWSDNSRLDFFNWAPNEPSSTLSAYSKEPCVEMWTDADNLGLWNDVKCYAARGYICSSFKDPSIPVVTNQCPEGYLYMRNSCYKVLTTKQSWNQSIDSCSLEGAQLMPLVEITDILIIKVLIAAGDQTDLWIGGVATGGNVKWNDGSRSSITIPNRVRTGCLYSSGTQISSDACTKSRASVCKLTIGLTTTVSTVPVTSEVPAVTNESILTYTCRNSSWFLYDSYCYTVVYESTSFVNTKCFRYGMHLASINSPNENYKLISWILHKQWTSLRAAYPYFWIGLSGDMPLREWSDGSSVKYTNIDDKHGQRQGCVMLMLYTGKWQVVSCTDRHFYICKGQADIMTTLAPTTTQTTKNESPRTKGNKSMFFTTKKQMTTEKFQLPHSRGEKIIRTSEARKLSGGQIAGVVIGVIGFVVITGVMIYTLRSWALKKPKYPFEMPSLGFDNALFHRTQDTVSIN